MEDCQPPCNHIVEQSDTSSNFHTVRHFGLFCKVTHSDQFSEKGYISREHNGVVQEFFVTLVTEYAKFPFGLPRAHVKYAFRFCAVSIV